ncbi:sensor histidine kinase [Helicovermis profundi]|uniref:histidine kinase n=1 Tax=Helicovermis profundi TaxID=3065157 RepID=A0AAU9E1Y6_9FIRM|nr:hypothetical protein HLPR_06590 [Clostridia bacterium S502]
MSIKKLFLLALIFVAIISVSINAIILTSLTDKYFADYLAENYKKHVEEVENYTKMALLEEDVSYRQMAIELETHLDDPIIRIKLYDANGEVLVDVDENSNMTGNMMVEQMMGKMMNIDQEETRKYVLKDNDKIIGILNITRHSSAENSIVAGLFKSALFRNSAYSVIIAIVISIIFGFLISSIMSRELKETAQMASNIQMGITKISKKSFVNEINRIRESLNDLNMRLKLKQKSRKTLIDQLVHQTRTPLTIIKSHLEAMEDGIIVVDKEELGICQNQVENITTIISNMSAMIDAAKESSEVSKEIFEINYLLKQITLGLKAQFDKKNIKLELSINDKIKIESDKYKLSQIIYNLLTNAYKYTENGGLVRVSYFEYEDNIIIKVQDTGLGIKESEIKNIFKAYYRSPSAVRTNGEGIGLYVVKENLDLINGSIKVESKKYIGSSFIVELPKKMA